MRAGSNNARDDTVLVVATGAGGRAHFASLLGVGSRSIPHYGHLPGVALRTSGCIGQLKTVAGGELGELGALGARDVGSSGFAGLEFVGAGIGFALPGSGDSEVGSAPSGDLSQYFAAVLMRASAAIRKTPEVATTSPGLSPESTS